jgi:hypothetical protein
MDVEYPGFGTIVVAGTRYDHDVVIDRGVVRRRDKGPSRPLKARGGGHTPLSAAEDIPWSTPRLVIGTGYSERLPILPEVADEAASRGVELVVLPTAEAVALLRSVDAAEVNALLHVTC